MYALIRLIPLYTYPYKLIAVIITALIVTVIALPIYCIYKLIISKVNEKTKKIFHRFLKIAGISILVLFFAELTVTLITEQHINKQLGFSYATPETPEGEPFLITRVETGKVMYNSGLKPGDKIRMKAVEDLYKLLVNNQGRQVVIPVMRDKSGIVITVMVPEMDLPLVKFSFLF